MLYFGGKMQPHKKVKQFPLSMQKIIIFKKIFRVQSSTIVVHHYLGDISWFLLWSSQTAPGKKLSDQNLGAPPLSKSARGDSDQTPVPGFNFKRQGSVELYRTNNVLKPTADFPGVPLFRITLGYLQFDWKKHSWLKNQRSQWNKDMRLHLFHFFFCKTPKKPMHGSIARAGWGCE